MQICETSRFEELENPPIQYNVDHFDYNDGQSIGSPLYSTCPLDIFYQVSGILVHHQRTSHVIIMWHSVIIIIILMNDYTSENFWVSIVALDTNNFRSDLNRTISLTRPNNTSVCNVRSCASSTIITLNEVGGVNGCGHNDRQNEIPVTLQIWFSKKFS